MILLGKLPILANEILMHQRQRREQEEDTATTITNAIAEATTDESTENSGCKKNYTCIEWDTEGWHYNGIGFIGDAETRRERVALYLLSLDAINFCFWPLPTTHIPHCKNKSDDVVINLLEYEHLAIALKKIAEADHVKNFTTTNSNKIEDNNESYEFSPKNLANMTVDKFEKLLYDTQYLDQTKYPVPNINQRCDLLREIGDGLLRHYDGSVMKFLRCANNDASRLVELIVTTFPGFRDEAVLDRRRVVFLKRAQIFVGDVNAALNLQLNGMDRLTTFADYRVPQLLRHYGILIYAPALADRVDNYQELSEGSFDEISIRAATVVVVEELVKMLNSYSGLKNETIDRSDHACSSISGTKTKINKNKFGEKETKTVLKYNDVTVDWFLWQVGECMHQKGVMKPFHRVRTHCY